MTTTDKTVAAKRFTASGGAARPDGSLTGGPGMPPAPAQRNAGSDAGQGAAAQSTDVQPIRRRKHLWLVPPLVARLLAVLTVALIAPVRGRRDAGMTTAEYAVGTIAACGFAAILYQVVTGQSIVTALGALISRALASL